MASAVVPNRRSVWEALSDPDNSPGNIAIIAKILQANRTDGTAAADGKQALRAATNHPSVCLGISSDNALVVSWNVTHISLAGHDLDDHVLCIERGLTTSNQYNLVKLSPADFNISVEIAVRSPEDTITEMNANPNATKLDPPTNGNNRSYAGPKLRCRPGGVHLLPGPASRLMKLQEEGKKLTWRLFFEEVYPTLSDAEKAGEWKGVIEHYQVLATGKTAGGTVSEAELATPPPLVRVDEVLGKKINEGIFELLPERRDGGTAAGLNQLNATLAHGLDKMDNQQELARREAREREQRKEEEKKKKKSLAGKLGEIEVETIKRFLGVTDESELLVGNLVWKKFAEQEAKTAESFRKCLQTCVDEVARQLGLFESSPIVPLAMATGIMDGEFFRRSLDDPASGWFTNFLLHGEQLPSFTKQQIQRSVATGAGSQVTLTPEQARELQRFKTLLPQPHEARRNVLRMLCVAKAVFPRGHLFLTHLSTLATQFENHYETIKNSCLVGTAMENAAGIIVLEAYGIKINSYFRLLYEGSADAAPEDPKVIFGKMRDKEQWVPQLSTRYQDCLGLKSFNGAVGDFVLENMLADGSGAGVSRVSGAQPSVVQPPPTQQGGGGQPREEQESGGNKTTQLKNNNYNEELFAKFRDVKGSDGRQLSLSKWKKDAIARNPLPKSKYGLPSMCLSWHSKGLCNSNCKLIGDHKPYSAAEYQPLCQWCTENWPAEGSM